MGSRGSAPARAFLSRQDLRGQVVDHAPWNLEGDSPAARARQVPQERSQSPGCRDEARSNQRDVEAGEVTVHPVGGHQASWSEPVEIYEQRARPVGFGRGVDQDIPRLQVAMSEAHLVQAPHQLPESSE